MMDNRPRTWLPALAGLVLLCIPSAMAAEGRTPIPFAAPVATPIVIDTPGSYVLTRNLTATGAGPAIQITATGVTLDLNGKVITPDPASPGIEIGTGAEATVRNGAIDGGAVGITGDTGCDATIEDVRIRSTSGEGILMSEAEIVVIRRTIIDNAGSIAIALEGTPTYTTQATIEDNLIRGSADGICVFIGGSVEISNNRLQGITSGGLSAGIIVESVGAALISHNTIEDTTNVNGIVLVNSDGATLLNNLVSDTVGGHGISFSSNDSFIVDNVVQNAGNAGLFISGDRNNVRGNTLSGNGSYGLHIGPTADFNVFTGNIGQGNSGDTSTCLMDANLCGPAGGTNIIPTDNNYF